jgi:hypothetical protein
MPLSPSLDKDYSVVLAPFPVSRQEIFQAYLDGIVLMAGHEHIPSSEEHSSGFCQLFALHHDCRL